MNYNLQIDRETLDYAIWRTDQKADIICPTCGEPTTTYTMEQYGKTIRRTDCCHSRVTLEDDLV